MHDISYIRGFTPYKFYVTQELHTPNKPSKYGNIEKYQLQRLTS